METGLSLREYKGSACGTKCLTLVKSVELRFQPKGHQHMQTDVQRRDFANSFPSSRSELAQPPASYYPHHHVCLSPTAAHTLEGRA